MEKRTKIYIALAAVILFALIFTYLNLAWVSSTKSYSLQEVIETIFGGGTWGSKIIIDSNERIVVIGILIGAGLAIAGCAMQAVFRNPLASPYILGLSSGASLGAAIGMLFVIPWIPAIIVSPLLAFVFAFITMAVVYMMARVGGQVRTETLVLAGVAMSSLLSALVSLLTFIAGEQMAGIVFWTMGDLSKATWEEIAFVAPIIIVGSVLLVLFARKLNAMMLGDIHAMDLGVNVKRTRLAVLIITTAIVAAAVAFVGVVGFIGLVIPHILRILLGPDNRIIMPLSIVTGSMFVLFCSFIARIVAPQFGVLPIGIITALIGAPVFIYLLIRRKKEVGWN